MESLKNTIRNLPDSPGIYQFFDKSGRLLYVGKSVSLKKRVSSYFSNKDLGPKTNMLVGKIATIKYIKVFSDFEALLLESELIRTHKPFFNIISKDDKSPLYIKISSGDVPLISTSRKETAQKGVFLKGPFPSTKVSREILRMIRKIFPYCQHANPKKPCLYVHLGLCPYPYQSEEEKKKYQNNIKKIKKLLSGKNKILINQLVAEMNDNSKKHNFEEANKIKKQIEKLEYLTTTFHDPTDFLNTPQLVEDQERKRIESLAAVLQISVPLKRIECYDISNIQGTNPTGSMVVFTNGKPDKSQYRKFKIQKFNTPNDYGSLKEVLTRRFKNTWTKPDLIIIDGGKGQLSAALDAISKLELHIPVISLAKRLEEIYTPKSPKPIRLTKEDPARQLAQAIRDEAHRFAVTYHKLLRSKNFLG